MKSIGSPPLRKMKARGHSLFLPQEQIQISHRTASGRTERISFLWKRPLSHWRPFLPRGVLVSTLSSVRRAVSGLKPSRHTGILDYGQPFLLLPSMPEISTMSHRTRLNHSGSLQTLLIIRCIYEFLSINDIVSGYLELLFRDCLYARI